MPIPLEFSARPSKDCSAYNTPMGALRQGLASLKEDCPILADLTAVDHGVESHPRFEMVYHLYNPQSHEYLRLASFCLSNEEPSAPSVSDLWPAANWHERECYDLFGIKFEGHPDLKRILLWEGYPYFPLRKEFPLSGIETPLPAQDVAEETGVAIRAAPMAGGPFVAASAKTMAKREPSGKDESWREGGQK